MSTNRLTYRESRNRVVFQGGHLAVVVGGVDLSVGIEQERALARFIVVLGQRGNFKRLLGIFTGGNDQVAEL